MRLRGRLKTRKILRLSASSSILAAVMLAVACSGGGGEETIEAAATPGALQSTPGPSPSARTDTQSPAGAGPVIVATPRAGASAFNDPDRDHSISGFIVDAAAGRPLRGVTVRETDGGSYGISDEFGFYRIDGLAPGRHGLDITGYRVEPATVEVETETWTRLDLSLAVMGDASSRRVFDIVGRVTNRDSGDPVRDATVSATEVDGAMGPAIATTDEFGAYIIPALPQGRYGMFVDAPGYPVYAEQLDVADDLAWEVFLRATPSRITGRVMGEGPDGSRLPVGASVRVISLDAPADAPGQSDRSIATSGVDSDGFYALADLPPGSYRMEAAAPGYRSSEAVIDLSSGAEAEMNFDLGLDGASLNIVLSSSTYGGIGAGNITVRIRGVGGTPAEGVLLDVVTGPDGSAAIGGLPAGMYDVWTPAPRLVSGDDSADLYPVQKTLQLGPGESRIFNADLPAIPGDVHGFVRAGNVAGETRLGTSRRDASTSSSNDVHESFPYLPVQLPGARVSITSAQFGDLAFSPATTSVTSDQYGNFVLPLPPGSYSFEVTAAGHVTTSANITTGSTPLANDFRLQKATTALVGRVNGTMIQDLTHLSDAAFAVAGASVVLEYENLLYSAETDERGVFAIEDLPLALVDGAVVATDYELRITHTDYLPLTGTLSLSAAEGAYRLVRELPTLAAGGFLNVAISVTDENGNKTAAIGTLESFQNIRTMDVYDASFLADAESIEIPNQISIRARPGQYRVRVCPETPGSLGCFDHFWTSVGGAVDTLDLSFNCGDTPRLVKCSLDGGISASSSGHIQATGFVYSASTGAPLTNARVAVTLNVLTEYCSEECTGFVREFSATGPTGPNGRYQLEFQIPSTNGGADLVGWSWDGGDRSFTVTSPGYETIVDTGPAGATRIFSGTQDFYLAPSARLNTLIAGASAEGPPVSGIDPGLGLPVGGQGRRAVVTLSPLGADLATGADGQVLFNVPPGTLTATVSAPGHYPYAASILVPDANDSESVVARFTLPIEQIPPPQVLPDTFRITQATDGRPLKGYVLRGISAPATTALWEVRVDRNGLRPLRPDFIDPIESVDLVIYVSESCGQATESGTLHLRGTLRSGSASGVGTWGGTFDVADLPCGVPGWRAEARTSRSVVTLGFDWPLWPSEQRYPLSLLTNLAGSAPTTATDTATGSVGSVLVFDATPRSLRIEHNGDYLIYEIPDIAVTSNFGPPTAGRLLKELSGGGSPFATVESGLLTASLGGETGLLDLQTPATDSAAYSIMATGLFSLDSAVIPASADASSWVESINATLNETRPRSVELSYVPGPWRSTLDRLAGAGVDGTVAEDVAADASWNLAPPPEHGEKPPLIGERRVVAGTRFEIVSVTEFEFATSIMSHLKVDGRLNARSAAIFAEVNASGSIREEETVASGDIGTSRELWSAWNSSRDTGGFAFFDRNAGTDSVARSSAIVGEPAWTEAPTTVLAAPGPGQPPEVIGVGGLPRPSISAGRNQDGKLLISSVSAAAGAAWPAATGVSLLESGEPGGSGSGSSAWSPPTLLSGQPDGMTTDTAITFGGDGDAMLVWSVIPDVGGDPHAFIQEAAGAELFYSRMDATSGTWSTPDALTSDNRPDFAPVIASDGENRIVLAWARDMDGNVLTADDIVVFASEWIAGSWTAPAPVMPAPGAVSELSISVASGTAVIGIVADTPGAGRSVKLSFNSLGRWSPANVIAGDRPGLADIAVIMDSPGLASVAWNESVPGSDDTRIVTVEATSAGVRGETVAVQAVAGFVDLALVQTPGSRVLAWVGDGGSTLFGSRNGLDGWSQPSPVSLASGRSSRFIAVPGNGGDTVLTFHEIEVDGIPGLALVPLPVR